MMGRRHLPSAPLNSNSTAGGTDAPSDAPPRPSPAGPGSLPSTSASSAQTGRAAAGPAATQPNGHWLLPRPLPQGSAATADPASLRGWRRSLDGAGSAASPSHRGSCDGASSCGDTDHAAREEAASRATTPAATCSDGARPPHGTGGSEEPAAAAPAHYLDDADGPAGDWHQDILESELHDTISDDEVLEKVRAAQAPMLGVPSAFKM